MKANPILCGLALIAIAASPATGQTHDGGHRHPSPPPTLERSPYSGLEKRPIKALSDQQIGDLKAGRGMGLALAAELNGYPGPLHVLELAHELHLSAEQKSRTEALLQAMRAEVVPLGERILLDEEELERLFAEKTVTRTTLEAATLRIGLAQAQLRAAHLRYHLSTAEVLSGAQISHYAVLRGYGTGPGIR